MITNMATVHEYTKYELNNSFADPNADLVIVCPTAPGSLKNAAFKVNRQDLAAHSTVFREMLQVSHQGETWCGLPVVKLEEPAKVMEVVLGAVCNKPEVFSSVGASHTVDWRDAFALWEAADKYGIHTLRGYAQSQLRLLMPTVPPLEALKIQVRAVTADDNCLAQAALDRAAQDHFPSESSYPILEQMRTRDLLRLVNICLKSITGHTLKLQQSISQLRAARFESDWQEREKYMDEVCANLSALLARVPTK